MLATRATQCHGQVAAIRVPVMGYPASKECADVLAHGHELVLAVEKILNFQIEPRQTAQFEGPVRIRQAPQVKHEICIGRDAELETKRLDQHRQGLSGTLVNT